jgi:preprotein translocase subunit YajC
MDFLISDALAQGAAAPQGIGLNMIVMVGAFFVIMYFMIIRPQSKQAKEHKQLMDSLSKGDEVVTGGGLMVSKLLPKGTLKNL